MGVTMDEELIAQFAAAYRDMIARGETMEWLMRQLCADADAWWSEETTLHDTQRVLVNRLTGERRLVPFDPPSAEVQQRIDELRREIEGKEPADPEKAGG